MKDIRTDNFGIVIAYLLPGVVVMWGVSLVSATVQGWFGAPPENGATVGGFLQVTLASLAAGLLVSAVRWAVLDTLHHATGVRKPNWNFGGLRRQFHIFEGLVENHYRYYQFYGNTLIAIIFLYVVSRSRSGGMGEFVGWREVVLLSAIAILFAGSRDTLSKYYERTAQLVEGENG